MHRALASFALGTLRTAVRGPERRSVVTGSALALTVWALATYGVRSEAGVEMALVIVVSGGTSALLFELERQCARLRLPPRKMLHDARRWICLQGAGLLATLAFVGTSPF